MRFAMMVVVLFLVLGTNAAAGPLEEPESLIRQGVELRHAGDDLRAEGYFKRAYDLAKTPRSSAQLGLVELALGLFADSNAHLAEALDSSDLWVQQQRGVLEKSRDRARAHLARIEIVGAPAGATVKVGTGASSALPEDGVLWIAPIAISLVIEAPGRVSTTRNVSVAAGGHARVVVELPIVRAVGATPASAFSEPPQPLQQSGMASKESALGAEHKETTTDSGRAVRIVGIAAAGTGVVASVTGVILYQIATTKRNAIAAALDNSTTQYSDSDLNWKTYDRSGVGFMIGGAIAVAGGAALYLVGRHKGLANFESSVSLWVTPAPGTVQLGGRF